MKAKMAIKKVAEMHHTSEREVHEEMLRFLEFAAKSSDPAVRAKWDAIPKKGKTLTVEEFIEYAAAQIRLRDTRLL